MAAYYNEHDPYAAQWLRNLIAAGLIAPGEVDERDVRDVRPDELRRFTQCHFFAGIGVWSLALRNAGWADDRPVWTGSCPCQPFSAAGRGGGTADERHLWPHWFHLIDVERPAVVFGEQVASKDGLGWLDLVHADLEGAGYAVGTQDLCAAGVGAPHIRQRLFFVGTDGLADPAGVRGWTGLCDPRARGLGRDLAGDGGRDLGLADCCCSGLEGCDPGALGRERPTAERGGGALGLVDHHPGQRGVADAGLRHAQLHDADGRGLDGWLALAHDVERGGEPAAAGGDDGRGAVPGWLQGDGEPRARGELQRLADACVGRQHQQRREPRFQEGEGVGRREPDDSGELQRLADADGGHARAEGLQPGGQHGLVAENGRARHDERPGPTNGGWRAADWLCCRDGRWRPVEPGSFPLAHGAPARVGRLRAYGNAIVEAAAREWIATFLESEREGHAAPVDMLDLIG